MQYQVPQFLEVEARIFGPLTIKQFIYLAGSGGVVFLFYTLTKDFFYTFIFSSPVVATALILAFKRVNNKPFSYILEAAVRYFLSHKLYLWKKTDKKIESATEELLPIPDSIIPKVGESKLKDMAWQLNVSNDGGFAKADSYQTKNIKTNETTNFIHEEKMIKAYSNLGKSIQE